MPTPYLSRLKLEKELEKKTRMLREKKEKCDSYIKKIQKMMKHFKIDETKMGDEFKQALEAYKIKNYEKALPLLEKVWENLQNLLHQNFEERKKSIEEVLEELDTPEIPRIKADLKEAENTLKKDAVHSFEILDNVDERMNKLVKYAIEAKIRELRETVASLEGYEWVKEKINSLGEDIQSLKVLRDIEKEAKEKINGDVEALISKCREIVNIASSAHYNIPANEDTEERIKNLFDNGNYREAISEAKEYYNNMKKRFSEFLNKLLGISRMLIEEGKMMDIDTSSEMDMLKKVQEYIKEEKFKETITLLRKATDSAENKKLQKVLDALKIVRDKFAEAKKRDIDITPFMKRIENSRNLIKIGQHKRAYDIVNETIKLVDRELDLYAQLESEIEELKKLVEDLRKENIILEGVEEKIKEIEVNFESKPKDAEREIDELKSLIQASLRDIALGLWKDMKYTVEKSNEIGTEVSDYIAEIERIGDLINQGNYREAIITLREMETEVYNRIYEYLASQIQSLKIYENEQINKEIENLKNALDSGEIKKSIEIYTRIYSHIFEIEGEKYHKMMENFKKDIEFLENRGANLAEAKGYLERTEKVAGERNLTLLKDYLKRVEGIVKKEFLAMASSTVESARNSVDISQKKGVDVEKTGLLEFLNDMEKSLAEGNYREAMEKAFEVRERAHKLSELVNKINTMKKKIEEKINIIENSKVNVDSLRENLQEAINALNEGKYEISLDILQGLEKDLKVYERRAYLENLHRKIISLEKISKYFNLYKDYSNLTRDFFKLYKKKKIEDAISRGEEILQHLRDILKGAMEDMVERIEKNVESLKKENYPIGDEENALKRVKENLSEGDLVKAYEYLNKLDRRMDEVKRREKRVRELIEEINKKLNFASSMGIDAEKYADLSAIANAPTMEEAENIAKRQIGSIDNKIFEKIKGVIESVDSKLTTLRRNGADVTAAESILTSAKELLRREKFKESLQKALEAMEEIENYEIQKSLAYAILKRVEAKTKKMKALLPLKTLKNYQEAKDLFLKGEYLKSIEKSMEVNEELWNISSIVEKIKERNEEIKKIVVKAHRSNMDVKKILKLFNDARREFQKLHYEQAYKLVEECYREARKLLDTALSQYRQVFEEITKKLTLLGLEKQMEEHINRILKLFEEEDIEALKVQLSSFSEEVNKVLDARMQEMVEENKKKMVMLETSGVEVPDELKIKIEKLSSLRGESPEDFVKLYGEIKSELDVLVPQLVTEKMEGLKDMLKEYESKGIDVSEYYEKISSFTEEDLGRLETVNRIESLKNNLKTYLGEYLRTQKSKMEDRVSKFSKSKAKEYSERIETLIKDEKYMETIETLKEAENYVANYRLNVQEFNTKVREFKDLLVQMANLGINVQSYVTSLKGILSNIIDIQKARADVEKLTSEVKEYLNSLTPKLEIHLELDRKAQERYHAKIHLKNTGNIDALNIHIDISGRYRSESTIEIPRVEKGIEEDIEILLLKGEGETTIVDVAYSRFDGKRYKQREKFTLQIKKGFRIEKNKERVKCAFCRGTILPGLDIVICENCGAVYHLQCAKRAGKCVKCGNPFNFE